jgi:hypothetical protein
MLLLSSVQSSRDACCMVQPGCCSAAGSAPCAAAELAEQCYEAARGAEPTLVPVWEAMAATAAANRSAAGTAAAAAAAEHAVGLGGGPESWLELATSEQQCAGSSSVPLWSCWKQTFLAS